MKILKKLKTTIEYLESVTLLTLQWRDLHHCERHAISCRMALSDLNLVVIWSVCDLRPWSACNFGFWHHVLALGIVLYSTMPLPPRPPPEASPEASPGCTKASRPSPEPSPKPCWTWPGSAPKPPRPSPEPSEPSPEPRWTWPGACTSAHRSYSGLKTPLAYAVGEKCHNQPESHGRNAHEAVYSSHP